MDPRALLAAERETTLRRPASLDDDYDAVGAASLEPNAVDAADAEGATIAFERSQIGALAASARQHLQEIEAAGRRVEDGTYGTCERCGRPIGDERLEARPTARTCIDCARLSR